MPFNDKIWIVVNLKQAINFWSGEQVPGGGGALPIWSDRYVPTPSQK